MNLEGANYFRFFTLLMFAASVIYIFVSRYYHERTYFQSQEPGINGPPEIATELGMP